MESPLKKLRCCRICSKETQAAIAVFGDEGKRLNLPGKIRKYLYITISPEDMLPKAICDSCCRRIEGIHKFAGMALTNQKALHKILTGCPNSPNTESVLEPKKIENKGLLHTYLTKGLKEDPEPDGEVTEMEVRIDPMSILQCSIEEDSGPDSGSLDENTDHCYNNDNNENDEKPYACPVCARFFSTELSLQNHVWCHTPQNRRVLLSFNDSNCPDGHQSPEPGCNNWKACHVCGKFVSSHSILVAHLETHMPKGKFECDRCKRVFKTQCNLHRHKEYHNKLRYPCKVCGRVYSTNSTLRAHSITHSDLRPHKCPQCEKTFKRNQDLKFHINQHTGARPYQCPFCPKAFASSGNCFSHRKRMHPMPVEQDGEHYNFE